jgi:hypothetical protein
MNNFELISQLDRLAATNHLSRDRKVSLAGLIGKEFKVSGILSSVRNTSGYLRKRELRKGKTLTLRLAGCATELTIRCNRVRSTCIADHKVTELFAINLTITGYDNVRQQLKADELGDFKSTTNLNVVNATGMKESDVPAQLIEAMALSENLRLSSADDQAAQLLAELERMQVASQQFLEEVAGDIDRAESSNIALVGPDTDTLDPAGSPAAVKTEMTESLGPRSPTTFPNRSPPDATPRKSEDIRTFRSRNRTKDDPKDAVIEGRVPVVGRPTGSRFAEDDLVSNAETQRNDSKSDVILSEVDTVENETHKHRLIRHRREILSDEQSPVLERDFGQLISLATGVPLEKVSEIQKELWRAVMNPSMFGKQRNIYNFYPFGDFKMNRDRETVNMGFKSAPVTQLAKHSEVENYPHSKFGTSNADSDHPPIAAHAVRIAATVVPIVGLSLPVTYDVIFETLQLLLKIFGVGKRRVSFSDIGEFVPVVLNGTLQYHFRPHRQLIRFVTESARAIVAIAEREGEGQLAFEADKGVPDRTVLQSRTRGKVDREKKNSNGCVLIILAIVVYQALKYLFG